MIVVQVLATIKMDQSMLTEDIDSSVRSTLIGKRIGYSSMVISSELAPVTLATLHKQRLRWSQGWAEVSAKYFLSTLLSRHTGIRQKLGFVLLLCWREIFVYLTFWSPTCLGMYLLRAFDKFEFVPAYTAAAGTILALGIMRVLAALISARGPIRSKRVNFLLYALLLVPYSVYLNIVQVLSHGRAIFRLDQWVATVRERK